MLPFSSGEGEMLGAFQMCLLKTQMEMKFLKNSPSTNNEAIKKVTRTHRNRVPLCKCITDNFNR